MPSLTLSVSSSSSSSWRVKSAECLRRTGRAGGRRREGEGCRPRGSRATLGFYRPPPHQTRILPGESEVGFGDDHSCVALRLSGAAVRRKSGQVLRITIAEHGGLRGQLLADLAHDVNLLGPQPESRVNAYILAASIGGVNQEVLVVGEAA